MTANKLADLTQLARNNQLALDEDMDMGRIQPMARKLQTPSAEPKNTFAVQFVPNCMP